MHQSNLKYLICFKNNPVDLEMGMYVTILFYLLKSEG